MKERGVDKRGQRIRTSEGLTNNAQKNCMKCTKKMNNKLGKRADNIKFDWVKFMSKEYFGVIDAITTSRVTADTGVPGRVLRFLLASPR